MILSSPTATLSVSVSKTPGKFSPRVRLPASSLSLDYRYSSITRAPFSLISICSSRRFLCPCVLSSTGVNSILEDEASETRLSNNITSHYRKFLDSETEEELLLEIRREAEAGRLPTDLAAKLKALYYSYRNAVLSSGSANANEVVMSNMKSFLELVHKDLENTFIFSPYHKAVRGPFNYYTFGVNYIRPLVDFANSYVGNVHIFNEIEQKLQQGHNVVLISNHQTEADPAIISLMLEATNPTLADNLIFIAGDRVITDPLCKPFSMGRNLICVYSKKHMNDAPELIEMKKRANITSMKEMAGLFKEGSKIVWIAPSGGRDRPGPTGEWHPAAFDVSAVENIRRLAEYADVDAHIYPLAILCHDILPPPPQVEKEIGEKRTLSYSGVGLSISREISFNETCGSMERNEAKEKFSSVLYESVTEQYGLLKSAMNGESPDSSLSQPWNFS